MSFAQIFDAITALKVPGSAKGVSRQAIKAKIGDAATAARLNIALKRAVDSGKILQVKGSFKLVTKKKATPKKKATNKKKKKTAKRGISVLLLGLDAAGKTTILYRLKLGQSITTIPTIGFNVETFSHRSVDFVVWDVGGQGMLRPLWPHYYEGKQGLMFVVDCADKERIGEAKKELHMVISDSKMKDASILVFANKHDLKGALSPEVMPEMLDLNRIDDRNWHVQSCDATTGDGLQEGLTWLSTSCNP